jgi:lipopolysaccharide export system ATP-binding protein
MTQNNSFIEATQLVKIYKGRKVVDHVDISVKSGEVVGLLGPNGAGKTTSFYMIVGLVSVTEGKICLDGVDMTQVPMYKRARMGIGYLPQEPSVFRSLTVEENIRAIVETLPISKKEQNERVELHLVDLDLTKVAKQKAFTLSGGERRRLEITRALITSPKFILMDEPFSGVDPISVYEVQKMIKALKERGIGILITDHNVRETLSVVDRAYLLFEGKLLREGTSEFLANDPESKKLYLGEHFNL